jgi:hypothetical protein
MEKNYKNATLNEILNNVVGKEGIKTDIAFSFTPLQAIVATVILIGSVTIGIILAGAIQKAVKK